MDSKMSDSLEEQKLGDTRQGSKGPERYFINRIGAYNVPFSGRWISQDEYTRRIGAPAPAPTSSEPAKGGMSAAELKAAQEAANKARREGKLSDLRGGPLKTEEPPKREQPKVEQPKPTGQKLVWNKQRMDFDTPDGKPAPYPTLPSPRNIDIKGLSAYRPGGPLPRLSSTGVSVSSSSTPAAPKPAGVSDGLKKWASIYGPTGPKKLKQPTPSQTRLFKDLKMEAYDVVLDYLLSEGHVDTVEEAHYVMMQMDAEYIQSIVEGVGTYKDPVLGPHTPGGKAVRKGIRMGKAAVQGYQGSQAQGLNRLGDAIDAAQKEYQK